MNKQHVIALNRRRSIIALLACMVELFCCLYSIYMGVTDSVRIGHLGSDVFRYFTVLSGIYGSLVASFIIPFAIDGFRRKRFTYPRWTALMHYSSAICTGLVFFFTVFFISFYDPQLAFGSFNFLLHIVSPTLILTAYFLVEAGHDIRVRDSFICTLPVLLYGLVYLYNVVVAKKWDDLYHLTDIIPFYISSILMLLLAYGIATAIRVTNNRKNAAYRKKMIENWDDSLDEVAIRIEAYGLGRYMGLHGDSANVGMNMDILEDISKKYGIRLESLTRAYGKGVIDGLKETREKQR